MLWLTLPLLIFALQHGPAHEKARGDAVGYWTPNSKDARAKTDMKNLFAGIDQKLKGYRGGKAVADPSNWGEDNSAMPYSKDARAKTDKLMHVDDKFSSSRGGGKAASGRPGKPGSRPGGMHGPPAHKGHHGHGKLSETAIDSLLDDIFASYGYTTRDEIFLIEELINEAFDYYGTSTDSLVAPGVEPTNEPTMEPSSFGMPTSGTGTGWTSGLETSSTMTATNSLDETVSSYGYGTTEDEATYEPTSEPTMEPSSYGIPTYGLETSSANTATDSLLDETVSSYGYGTTEDEANEPTNEPTMEPSSYGMPTSGYGYGTGTIEDDLIEEILTEAFESTYGTGSPESSGTGWSGAGGAGSGMGSSDDWSKIKRALRDLLGL